MRSIAALGGTTGYLAVDMAAQVVVDDSGHRTSDHHRVRVRSTRPGTGLFAASVYTPFHAEARGGHCKAAISRSLTTAACHSAARPEYCAGIKKERERPSRAPLRGSVARRAPSSGNVVPGGPGRNRRRNRARPSLAVCYLPRTPRDAPCRSSSADCPAAGRADTAPRRSDLVSVWIATSHPCDVALLLFEGADIRASETPLDVTRAKWVSRSQPTLQVGANLHVLTVVLDLRVPGGNASSRRGATLAPNIDYCYDLRITESRPTNTPRTLQSRGMLAAPSPLGYDPDELPGVQDLPAGARPSRHRPRSCRQLFPVPPPVEDDPADDDEDFRPLSKPPAGWPGQEPTEDEPVYTQPPQTQRRGFLDDFRMILSVPAETGRDAVGRRS